MVGILVLTSRAYDVNIRYYDIDVLARSIDRVFGVELNAESLMSELISLSGVPLIED